MISDRFAGTATVVQLQRAVTDSGVRNVFLSLVALGVLILVVDYAHMLYLHFVMVSEIRASLHHIQAY